MYRDSLPPQVIKQRLSIVSVCLIGLATLVTLRLFDIQVIAGSVYRELAEQNRLFTFPVSQSRAVFYDRYGLPLVVNTPQYSLADDAQALYIKKNPLSREEALAAIATDSGALVSYTFARQYLYPRALSHVLGYVGPVTGDELKQRDDLRLEDQVGKSGLERTLDRHVRGMSGVQVYEINALGQRQRLVREEPGSVGTSQMVSIDPVLSEVFRAALGENAGAGVIMDAETGQVLSMISYPDYDPNLMLPNALDPEAEQQRRQVVSQLLTDERQVFFNRALSGEYPPGSVFKIVTAIAGLDSGAIDQNTTVVDEGVLTVGEYSYGNWYYSQFGGVDGEIAVQRAIARSNDIYFYKAAEWTGPSTIAAMARMFGYGEPTGVELAGEADGLIPDPEWKEALRGERWYLGNTYHYGIGQGDTLVTPLQVAQMTQTVVNRGEKCRASIFFGVEECVELGLQEEHLRIALNGMLDACSTGGTAGQFFARNAAVLAERGETEGQGSRDAFTDVQQGMVACKTGTAEFGAANERGLRRTHGWFTAAVGVQPQTAVATDSVELATTASAAATPQPENLKNTELHTQILAELRSNPGAVDYTRLHQLWTQLQATRPFPQKIVFALVVESSDEVPFREGSRHAAPVVKNVIDWIETGADPTD